jgi:hypothetical protein
MHMESTVRFLDIRPGLVSGSLALVAAAVSVAACDYGNPAPDACLLPSSMDDAAPVTRFDLRFVTGDVPLTAGGEATSSRGVKVKATKGRFYLSQPKLVDADGQQVPTELVDENGDRLPYGVTLVDFESPASMKLYLRAPAGSYRGLSASIGVPTNCESGERLNHSDASAMKAPLDVDTDMYWSWNPGYVFLKFEGQVAAGTGWERFFYHVGEDKRFAAVELRHEFTIGSQGGSGPTILADFERLLTAATGEARPDITDAGQRRVHGGGLADALAENIRQSGFLRFQPGQQ